MNSPPHCRPHRELARVPNLMDYPSWCYAPSRGLCRHLAAPVEWLQGGRMRSLASPCWINRVHKALCCDFGRRMRSIHSNFWTLYSHKRGISVNLKDTECTWSLCMDESTRELQTQKFCCSYLTSLCLILVSWHCHSLNKTFSFFSVWRWG